MNEPSQSEALFQRLFAITKLLRAETRISWLHAWIQMHEIAVAECQERLGEYDRAEPSSLLPEFNNERVKARADYEQQLVEAEERLAIGRRELGRKPLS